MNTTTAIKVAELSFARGNVGQRYPLTDEAAVKNFSRELQTQTVELTKKNTADCGDERLTLGFADGTTDKDVILARVVAQLLGGIGLATTKAVVAANAAIIRDSRNMWGAYTFISDYLSQLGYEDAGHASCGASLSVQQSVEKAIDMSVLVPSVGLIVGPDTSNQSFVKDMSVTKSQRLESGFYDWDNKAHENYLTEKYPQNFAYLLEDANDHETHGHNGSGLYAITQSGHGFVKNGKAFGVTIPLMQELAFKLGGSDEERRRIFLGFADDTLHVGAGIVTSGFPVFAEAV